MPHPLGGVLLIFGTPGHDGMSCPREEAAISRT
jgi:hypothetical protein